MTQYIFALFIAIGTLFHPLHGWWGDDKKDDPKETEQPTSRPPLPFDRTYIEPYCHRIFEDSQYRTRTSSEMFYLKPSKKCASILKGTDEMFGFKVKLEFCNNNKLISCQIRHGQDLYYPHDIWMMELGPNKCFYVFSFLENDTSLIVHKSKHHIATAQWALFDEVPRRN